MTPSVTRAPFRQENGVAIASQSTPSSGYTDEWRHAVQMQESSDWENYGIYGESRPAYRPPPTIPRSSIDYVHNTIPYEETPPNAFTRTRTAIEGALETETGQALKTKAGNVVAGLAAQAAEYGIKKGTEYVTGKITKHLSGNEAPGYTSDYLAMIRGSKTGTNVPGYIKDTRYSGQDRTVYTSIKDGTSYVIPRESDLNVFKKRGRRDVSSDLQLARQNTTFDDLASNVQFRDDLAVTQALIQEKGKDKVKALGYSLGGARTVYLAKKTGVGGASFNSFLSEGTIKHEFSDPGSLPDDFSLNFSLGDPASTDALNAFRRTSYKGKVRVVNPKQGVNEIATSALEGATYGSAFGPEVGAAVGAYHVVKGVTRLHDLSNFDAYASEPTAPSAAPKPPKRLVPPPNPVASTAQWTVTDMTPKINYDDGTPLFKPSAHVLDEQQMNDYKSRMQRSENFLEGLRKGTLTTDQVEASRPETAAQAAAVAPAQQPIEQTGLVPLPTNSANPLPAVTDSTPPAPQPDGQAHNQPPPADRGWQSSVIPSSQPLYTPPVQIGGGSNVRAHQYVPHKTSSSVRHSGRKPRVSRSRGTSHAKGHHKAR